MKPFAEVSIVQRVNEHSTVQQYKYFKVLIQEFHIKVDIGFINALVKMFEAEATTDDQEVKKYLFCYCKCTLHYAVFNTGSYFLRRCSLTILIIHYACQIIFCYIIMSLLIIGYQSVL